MEAPEIETPEEEEEQEAEPTPKFVKVHGERITVIKLDEVEGGIVITGTNGCTYRGVSIENGTLKQ
ncbi:MAG: hypothetical protein WC332_02760 [Clostridia bacterium]